VGLGAVACRGVGAQVVRDHVVVVVVVRTSVGERRRA
jgi:hypothetical protein